MYKIYAEEMAVTASKLCIYHDAENLESICLPDPKLTMEDNSAGQLTLTMPPANAGYDSVNRLTTTLTVYKDDVEIWSGRVISEDMDFWNQRSLTCEGELAFLNDSIQPPEEYHIESTVCVEQFLIDLIAIHNAQVEDYKKFKVGTVTVHDSNGYLYKYTNYNTTWDCIQEKLLDTYGGHLVITKDSDGTRVLNYYDSYPGTSTQRIEFGKNLLDFTKSWDMTDFATVILPRGAQLEQEVEYDGDGNVVNSTEYIEALVPYTNLEDYSATSGSIVTRIYSGDDAYLGQYVINTEAVANYGWISVVVDWSDVTEKGNLWNKAVEYLEDIQFDDLQLEINAVDLHYLGADYDTINLLDQVVVLSRPHGLVGSDGTGKEFPVTKLDIPLNDPENATFTFGDKVNNTLTGSTRSANSDILNRIASMKLPDVSSEAAKLLEEAISVAQENANNMIARATEGFITIVYDQDLRFPESKSQAIYISNDVDYTAASDFWVWNSGGLAHYHQGTANRIKDANGNWIDLPDVAINMDGSIYASYITAGVITADLITAGTLTNTTGTFYLDLNNNVLRLGPWTVNNYAFYYGNSSVSSTPSSTSVGPYIYFGTDGLNLAWSSHAYMRVQSGQLTAFGADIITSNGTFSTEMEGGYLKVYFDTRSTPDYGVSSTYLVGGIHAIYWEPNYVQTGYKRMALDISSESNGHFVTLGGVPNNSSTYIVKLLVNSKSITVYDSSYATYNEDVIVFGSFYASSIRMSDVLRINITDSTSDWSAYAYYNTLPATFNLSISGASVKYATSAGSADSATTATKWLSSKTLTISAGTGYTSGSVTSDWSSGTITIDISSMVSDIVSKASSSAPEYEHPMSITLDDVTLNKGLTIAAGGYLRIGDYQQTGAYADTVITNYAYEYCYGRMYMYGNNYFGGSSTSESTYTQYFYGSTYFYNNLSCDGTATFGRTNNYTTYFYGSIMMDGDQYGSITIGMDASAAKSGFRMFSHKGNRHVNFTEGVTNGNNNAWGFCYFVDNSGSDGTYWLIWKTTSGSTDTYHELHLELSEDIYIGYDGNCDYMYIGTSGTTVYQFGNWNGSDILLKTNVYSLEEDSETYLHIIDNITPVSYIYTDDQFGRQRFGYIANEVLEACNGQYALVTRNEDNGLLYLNYTDLIPLLHLKIKQLEKRIEELESPTIIEEDD